MFAVKTGAKNARDGCKLKAMQTSGLLAGSHYLWQPLNGSSEDRQEARAHYRELAIALKVPFQSTGFHCVMGGPHRRGRGRRYMQGSTGFPRIDWMHWRKAKRLERKGLVRGVE